MLPSFIIIGERRAGTTSLTRWMEGHSEIFIHPHIDMAYFIEDVFKERKDLCRGRVNPEEWVKTHSSEGYSDMFAQASNQKAVGEKSADYLFWTPAHERIKACCPDIKLVVTLRNPIDRAWSHYWNEVGKGREHLPFEQAIDMEHERADQSDFNHFHLSYIERGKYAKSLKKLYETFDPSQVCVVTLDDLKSRPHETLKEVYAFLGVSTELGLEGTEGHHNKNWTTFQSDFVQRHRWLSVLESLFVRVWRKVLRYVIRDHYKRTQAQLAFERKFRRTTDELKIQPHINAKLQRIYEPHIEATEQLLEKDLTFWKT